MKIAFFLINAVFISFNFIDIAYFKFTAQRSTFNLITASGMREDVIRILPSFISDFWYLFIMFSITIFIFWKLIPSIHFEKNTIFKKKEIIYKIFFGILILLISVILARGGFQKIPITKLDAINYTTVTNTDLVLNTPFCVLKSFKDRKNELKYITYFDNKILDSIYHPYKHYNTSQSLNKKNIIIIILESFGSTHIGFLNNGNGYTPFLDSLIEESLFFKNAFANGTRSVEAVPSIVSGIPSLMDESFIGSQYITNKVIGLPIILNQLGYHTSFFHGGQNGSNKLDSYSVIAGFNEYYGRNEYPYDNGDDDNWGIFDEEFLLFFCNKLSEFKQPFFSTVFTLSSHFPYVIPERYEGEFPKGTKPIHESIGYADYALRKFFNEAKKQDWYNNTLFVLTSDHTSWDFGFYNTNIGKFAIPILFFDPLNKDLKKISEKVFQQIDIQPSILNYIHYPDSFLCLGNSWNENIEFAAFRTKNVYHFIGSKYKITYDGNSIMEIFKWKEDRLQKNNLIETHIDSVIDLIKYSQAYLQSFNNRMIDDKLYYE